MVVARKQFGYRCWMKKSPRLKYMELALGGLKIPEDGLVDPRPCDTQLQTKCVVKALFNSMKQFSPFMLPDSCLLLYLYNLPSLCPDYSCFLTCPWKIISSIDANWSRLNFPVQFMNIRCKLVPQTLPFKFDL